MNTQPTPQHKFYVYAYTDVRPGKEGNVIYVGKGCSNHALRRMYTHWVGGNRVNPLLNAVLNKHREMSLIPKIEVLSWHELEQDAFYAEMAAIATHKLRKHGGTLCNLTLGGEGTTGYTATPDEIKRNRLAGLRRWQDPEFRDKLFPPGRIEEYSKFMKTLWETPEYSNKVLAAQLAAQQRPEVKSRKSEAGKERWSDPEYKERTAMAIKAAKTTPEARAKVSEINKKIWSDPMVRETFSKRMKEVLNNPEEKARKSAATKLKWQDPAFREKMRLAKLNKSSTPNVNG